MKGKFFSSLLLLLCFSLFVPGILRAEENRATAADTAGKAAITAVWHPQNLQHHWNKHGREFPEFKSAEEYGNAALEFFANPPKGTLRKFRGNGDKLYYYQPKNWFGVTVKDGTPKTFFRPNRGIRYWNRQ